MYKFYVPVLHSKRGTVALINKFSALFRFFARKLVIRTSEVCVQLHLKNAVKMVEHKSLNTSPDRNASP